MGLTKRLPDKDYLRKCEKLDILLLSFSASNLPTLFRIAWNGSNEIGQKELGRPFWSNNLGRIGYGTICRKTICRKLTQEQFAEFFSANCPWHSANCHWINFRQIVPKNGNISKIEENRLEYLEKKTENEKINLIVFHQIVSTGIMERINCSLVHQKTFPFKNDSCLSTQWIFSL